MQLGGDSSNMVHPNSNLLNEHAKQVAIHLRLQAMQHAPSS
jgi:hypothetical protein